MLPANPLLKEVTNLQCVKCIKIAVRSSVKYGLLVGGATMISGIFGGPLGMTIGGIASSCIAGYVSKNEFQSVPYIIWNKTTPEQREELAKTIWGAIKPHHISTVRDFILSIENDTQLQDVVIQVLIMFFSSQGYSVMRT